MKKFTLSLALLSALTLSPLAFAQSMPSAHKDVVKFPLSNDLYVSGGDITLSEAVQGDLLIAGGNVTVMNNVNNDLMAAGGDVSLRGNVNDDLRAAGGTIHISGTVKGDALVAGGKIFIEPTAVITGELVIFGGEIHMQGTAEKGIKISGRNVTLAGTVKGTADIKAEALTIAGIVQGASKLSADTIALDPAADLRGSVEYWRREGQMDFSPAFKTSTATATLTPALARNMHDTTSENVVGVGAALLGMWTIFTVLSSALIITVLFFLTPNLFRRAGETVLSNPWKSLLTGFLYYIAAPVVIVLLMLTIVGIPLALILLCVYLLTLFFCGVLSSLVLARSMEKYFKKKWHGGLVILLAVAIYFVLKALWFIPVLGWLARLIVMCLAIGALWMSLWAKRKTGKA